METTHVIELKYNSSSSELARLCEWQIANTCGVYE